MSSPEFPDLAELKSSLKEADAYEQGMSVEDMRSVYTVIKSTESDAMMSNKTMDDDDHDDQFTASVMNAGCSSKQDDDNKATASSSSNWWLNVKPIINNSIKVEFAELKVEPPPHVNPLLLSKTPKERYNIISEYHNEILNSFNEYQKTSNVMIPFSKPIVANAAFNGSLDRKNSAAIPVPTGHDENGVYTLRSGRQTKKKVYTEVFNDGGCKRVRKNDENNIEEYKPSKERRKQFINTEKEPIKSRTDKLFDALKSSDKKRQQDEEKIEVFKESISDVVDEELVDDIIPNSQPEDNELFNIYRRISPPVHGRRGIRRENTNDDKSKPKNEASSTQVKGNKAKQGKTKCPICGDCFLKSEIEQHASNCGLGME